MATTRFSSQQGGGAGDFHSGGTLAAQSQLSCVRCRSRKLRCDRKRPRCDRCAQQNEECTYPGSRQRVLGRRRTVRELEERIEELEGLLSAASLGTAQEPEPGQGRPSLLRDFQREDIQPQHDPSFGHPPLSEPGITPGLPHDSATQLVSLGLFEQLPPFEIIDELTSLYFRNIHNGAPMLHQASYTAALRLPPHMRPPMCLQYIVMASGAATSENYRHLSEAFYQRARVYAEADELKGQGETSTTLAHVHTWCLISAYECHVYAIFTRASTSLCRGVRIAQMLRLHQLDRQSSGLLHSPLPPPRTRIEAEERRRTWWVTFLADRFLSSITGWPSLVDERHVCTNLPCSDEAFAAGTEEATPKALSEGLSKLEQGLGGQVSPFAVRIIAANELLHALDHSSQHQPSPESSDISDDPYQNGPVWGRHREIDGHLTTLSVSLPQRLRVSRGNPCTLDAILVNTCTNMASIQLHRAALGMLHRRHPPGPQHMIAQSRARLLMAAEGILTVFRAAGDGLGTAIRNPLLSFAAYLAASVFLEDCLFDPDAAAAAAAAEDNELEGLGPRADAGARQTRSGQAREGLDFLARALLFFGRTSPLVRSIALQLAADLKQTGYDASAMDQVMAQVQTLGGSASEIVVPGTAEKAKLFCPALTSTHDLAQQPQAFGSGYRGGGGGGVGGGVNDDGGYSSFAMPQFDGSTTAPGPSVTVAGRAGAPSVLQAATPDGLFSQLAGSSGTWPL